MLIWGGCWRILAWVWYLDLDLDLVNGLLYTHDSKFGYLSWFWRFKQHPCSLSPHLGLLRMLEVPDWDLASWSWFRYGYWSLYNHDLNLSSLSWFLRCKEKPCPLSPHLGLLRMLEDPDWGLTTCFWFGYGHWSLVHPCSKFWLFILNLKVQRTTMSFMSWFETLVGVKSYWLGFSIFIRFG